MSVEINTPVTVSKYFSYENSTPDDWRSTIKAMANTTIDSRRGSTVKCYLENYSCSMWNLTSSFNQSQGDLKIIKKISIPKIVKANITLDLNYDSGKKTIEKKIIYKEYNRRLPKGLMLDYYEDKNEELEKESKRNHHVKKLRPRSSIRFRLLANLHRC